MSTQITTTKESIEVIRPTIIQQGATNVTQTTTHITVTEVKAPVIEVVSSNVTTTKVIEALVVPKLEIKD